MRCIVCLQAVVDAGVLPDAQSRHPCQLQHAEARQHHAVLRRQRAVHQRHHRPSRAGLVPAGRSAAWRHAPPAAASEPQRRPVDAARQGGILVRNGLAAGRPGDCQSEDRNGIKSPHQHHAPGQLQTESHRTVNLVRCVRPVRQYDRLRTRLCSDAVQPGRGVVLRASNVAGVGPLQRASDDLE